MKLPNIGNLSCFIRIFLSRSSISSVSCAWGGDEGEGEGERGCRSLSTTTSAPPLQVSAQETGKHRRRERANSPGLTDSLQVSEAMPRVPQVSLGKPLF